MKVEKRKLESQSYGANFGGVNCTERGRKDGTGNFAVRESGAL